MLVLDQYLTFLEGVAHFIASAFCPRAPKTTPLCRPTLSGLGYIGLPKSALLTEGRVAFIFTHTEHCYFEPIADNSPVYYLNL